MNYAPAAAELPAHAEAARAQMVFSQATFLFYFLPIFLALYALALRKNPVLLLASLIFYAWGEPIYIALLLAVIGVNYVFGLAVSRTQGAHRGRLVALAVALDVGVLVAFKYAGFLAENLDAALLAAGLPGFAFEPPPLPLGISFFIFQAITYVVDVHRGDAQADRNPFNVALYISMFPQLVAGPIVRYREIAEEIRQRAVNLRRFAGGAERFLVGLAKKVVLADTLALTADAIFGASTSELPVVTAWFGLLCFTLQIYYDFSGYTDMAIGLGRMLGFRFPENFDHPYESRSVREFWRRWHMTLSRWFRDYVYIPLGGGRVSTGRVYLNLFAVFALTGLWHGASWNFLVWGLFHGAFLVSERVGLDPARLRLPRPVQHVYTLLAVAIGWVFFRATDLAHAFGYLGALVGLGSGEASPLHSLARYASPYVLAIVALGIVFSTDGPRRVGASALRWMLASAVFAPGGFPPLLGWARAALLFGLVAVSLSGVASQSYQAFLYFRF